MCLDRVRLPPDLYLKRKLLFVSYLSSRISRDLTCARIPLTYTVMCAKAASLSLSVNSKAQTVKRRSLTEDEALH